MSKGDPRFGKVPDEVSVLPGCEVCGGMLAAIRGRNPGDELRVVCPTCLADRMATIHELSSLGSPDDSLRASRPTETEPFDWRTSVQVLRDLVGDESITDIDRVAVHLDEILTEADAWNRRATPVASTGPKGGNANTANDCPACWGPCVTPSTHYPTRGGNNTPVDGTGATARKHKSGARSVDTE